jgi:hypothetical protein
MRFAFKEWGIVVDALGSGEQILILRKGGVSEGRRGFQVDYSEFLLYPTHFHEQRNLVTAGAQERFDQLALSHPEAEHVRLEYVAHVVSWRRIESLETAERLRGQHIWRDEVIAQRFEWGNDQNIYALAVRVFRLPQPIALPVLPGFSGCKSWIDLEQEIDTEGAKPVLDKEAFNEKLNQCHAALDWEELAGEEPGKPV